MDKFLKQLEDVKEISRAENKTDLDYQEAGYRLSSATMELMDKAYGYDKYNIQTVLGNFNASISALKETPVPGTEPNQLFPGLEPFKLNFKVSKRENSVGLYKGVQEIQAFSSSKAQLWYQKADGEWVNLIETRIPFEATQTLEVYPVWTEGDSISIELIDNEGWFSGDKRKHVGMSISSSMLSFPLASDRPFYISDIQNEKGLGSMDVKFIYPVFADDQFGETLKISDFNFTFNDGGDGGASNFQINSVTSTEGTALTGGENIIRFNYSYSGEFDSTDKVNFESGENGVFFKGKGPSKWINYYIGLKRDY